MKKTELSKALAFCIGASSSSVHAIDVDVTNMDFDGTIYTAEGQLRDDEDDFGTMQSSEDFFSNPWSAVGIAYFEAGNPVPKEDNDTISDEPNITNGAQPASWGTFTQTTSFDSGSNMYTWSGMSVSGNTGAQQPFSFTFALASNEVAWGTLFNWNGNQSIPVLNVMDCTDPTACAGVAGTPMVNGPFNGSDPLFSGGLPPMSCVDSFQFSAAGALDIDIATSLTEACSNPQAAVTLVSIGAATTAGGTAVVNGTNITYTPPFDGFNGVDDFVFTATDGVSQSTANYLLQVGGELKNNFSMLDRTGNVFGGTNDVEIVWDETSFNVLTVDVNNSPIDTAFGVMTIGSPQPFFNFNWVAHHVRIFKNTTGAPVTLNFDVTCRGADYDAGTVDCNKPLAEQGAEQRFMTMTLEDGEIGGHILFDWGKDDATTPCGKANCDIDVVNKWVAGKWDNHGDTAPVNAQWIGAAGVPPATPENSADPADWVLASTDLNGDGINASPMIDGAFVGSYANFNYKPNRSGTPLEPVTTEISDVDIDGFSFSLWTLVAGLISLFGLRRIKRN